MTPSAVGLHDLSAGDDDLGLMFDVYKIGINTDW